MRPRSLTLAQREVLLAFLTAAQDQRRQTLGDLPGEPWDVLAAFDELLDMGLLKVVPCVRLEIQSRFFAQVKRSETTQLPTSQGRPENQRPAQVVG